MAYGIRSPLIAIGILNKQLTLGPQTTAGNFFTWGRCGHSAGG